MNEQSTGGEGSHPLELDPATLRAWTEKVLVHLEEYVAGLPQESMGSVGQLGLVQQVPDLAAPEPIPRTGTDMDTLLAEIFSTYLEGSYNTASAGYLGYIPGGGLLQSALADFITAAVNRYVGVHVAAPRLAAMEAQVLRWFADLMGMPAETRGLLTTGGSLANFSAVVTARVARLPEDFLDGVLYVSEHAHHSITKAAHLAGLPRRAVRSLPLDSAWRLDCSALEVALREDRAAGRRPFMVVGSGGTTQTGAVDDLRRLAEISAAENLWLHVDAAYGGFFQLTRRGRLALDGIQAADSITLDPHKGLFLPYGTGALLVRNGEDLRRAHAASAEYMPAMQASDHPLVQDFCEYGPELSRDCRGLRVWLPLKLHGLEPFIASLDEKLDLTRHALEGLRALPGMEILSEPVLSVLTFRLRPAGMADEACDELTRRLLERVQSHDRIFMTATTLAGAYALRLCILSYRTHRDRVDEALEIIRHEAEALLALPQE
jgi:aromatic-L-amino-acid decarboxylase